MRHACRCDGSTCALAYLSPDASRWAELNGANCGRLAGCLEMTSCGSSGRGPVQDVSLDQNVVRTSFLVVRASHPPARHDGIECRHFHDMTLNRPQPPRTAPALKIAICAPSCTPCVYRMARCRRWAVRYAPQSKRGQHAGRRRSARGGLRPSRTRDFLRLRRKSRFAGVRARRSCTGSGVSRSGRAVPTLERA